MSSGTLESSLKKFNDTPGQETEIMGFGMATFRFMY